ncbi:MAG: cation diffusion facilitator family transporter [Candidatus Methylacidiphilales bacterium]|nr:cation diffusion facilitator family transporter [Candidatus Methylacidiphilales bacterium]
MEKRVEIATKTSLLGVCVNMALAAIKITTGVVGNSYALIADGIESLGDIFASLVVWRGVVVAALPPDEDHPYGHGRAETIATAVVALMLIAAAMLIIYESVNEIMSPHGSPAPFTLLVLAMVIAVKESLYRFVDKAATSAESSAVQADAWHHRADALTSGAAFIGITIALIGGKGWEGADDVAAIFAGCVIAYNGAHILSPVISEIMETAPEAILEPIRSLVATLPGIQHVDKCRASQVGFRMFVDLHIHVDPHMTVAVSHALAHSVKDEIRTAFSQVADVTIHVEPCRKMMAQEKAQSEEDARTAQAEVELHAS